MDRTEDPPFPDATRTGRAFITPCCTASIREFPVGGQTWLASSVAGYGWSQPWQGSLDDINDTGTLVDSDATERPVRWRPTAGEPG